MNVLVYVMDALRPDFLSCYGHEFDTSPEIDTFQEDAMRFTNAYSTATWTKPAAASLLTSRQPRSLNMMHIMDRMSGVDSTLPEHLSTHGFDTYAVSANHFVSEDFGFDGFDEFVQLQTDMDETGDRRTVEKRGPVADAIEEQDVDDVVIPLSEDINDRLSEWISPGLTDTLMLAWSVDTHGPYFVRGDRSEFGNDSDDFLHESEVTSNTVEKTKSLYRDMIRYNDRQFGQLLDTLRSTGLYNDTLIILTADHGESFGDHDSFFGRPIFGHSSVVYDEVVRVPLLVKFPQQRFANETREELAQLLDILPTIADVVEIDPPEHISGRSLHPSRLEASGARSVFVESQPSPTARYSGALRRGDQKLISIEVDWQWRREWRRMVENLLWKLTVPGIQLYDLSEDPTEELNLAGDRPAVVEELTTEFEEWRDRLERESHEMGDMRIDEMDQDVERDLKALGYLE